MADMLPQPKCIPAGIKGKVLRVIAGYCLDQWGYRYLDGIYGDDQANQFTLQPGAFDESLSRGGEVILTQDLSGVEPFARLSDGTLRLRVDEVGLMCQAILLDTPRNRELCDLIDAGRVRGWSHRFETKAGDYDVSFADGVQLVTVRRAELTEICLVIHKRPRQRVRRTPIFVQGGPPTASPLPTGTIVKSCCCQTSESTGITVCAEMSRADCISLGGTFLGNGSRCWLEGCGVCDYPGDCSTFCDTYLLRFYLAAPVGCVAFPTVDFSGVVLTRDGDPTDACLWHGDADGGNWFFALVIDTATSPPTRTLTATYANGEDSIIITAESTVGFCEAPSIALAITSYIANICDSDPPTASSIILTQGEGCPDFLP